jgi:hypothetical protein
MFKCDAKIIWVGVERVKVPSTGGRDISGAGQTVARKIGGGGSNFENAVIF